MSYTEAYYSRQQMVFNVWEHISDALFNRKSTILQIQKWVYLNNLFYNILDYV